MKKNCNSQAFLLIDTIIRMSPKHKNISRQFMLWEKCITKGTMKDLSMGIEHISEKCDCSEDTVHRFFEKYPYMVRRYRRKKDPGSKKRKTNLYICSETFIHAMQFMDAHQMIDGKTRRQQKTWYMNEMRKDLAFLNEDVGICDLQRPNLRPNPLLIPGSYRSYWFDGKTGGSHMSLGKKKKPPSERFLQINPRVDSWDIDFESKLKLSLVPEAYMHIAIECHKISISKNKMIRNDARYVAGTAIQIAIASGAPLDWGAYYATLRRHQKIT